MLTLEFVVWSNCSNNCRFCWQRLFNDKTTWLDEQEKLKCIDLCSEMIDEKGLNCDILVVGGEAYCDQGPKVNEKLAKLYAQIADKIKVGEVRFLYANTNLCYENRVNLVSLFQAFEHIEDHLKFTTSYDLDGRFNRASKDEDVCFNKDKEKMFLDNLSFINDNFPKINTVVNTIITRAVVDAVLGRGNKEKYDTHWFKEAYPNTVVDVNLIPYIPIKGDTGLDTKFSETVKVLEEVNKKNPGYLRNYVNMFDLNQDKLLYEYHSNRGLVERTAGVMPCGHNENFSLVNRAGECYICKLKEYLTNNQDRL